MAVWQTYLHFNVQDASPVLLRNILDGLDAGTVVVRAELSMLDEATSIYKLQEVLLSDEVILFAILLCASRGTGSVRDGEAKAVRVLLQETVKMGRLAGARGSRDDNGSRLLF